MDTVRSSKPDHQEKAAKQKRKYLKWALLSTILTFSLSVLINIVSEVAIKGSPAGIALCVLLAIILIGVLFDVVGTAVTAAEEAPFHSMASRRVKGASKGIVLLRNAERVSNICNDVIGDICGIVSGSTTAVIVGMLFEKGTEFAFWGGIVVTACVASLTVGGKAFGKGIAISKSNDIVFVVAKALSVFEKDAKTNGKKKNSK